MIPIRADRRWSAAALSFVILVGVTAPRAEAQGAVTGQVTLLERPGERTTDLDDVVVWLEPSTPGAARAQPAVTRMQLQNRQFSPRVRAVPEGSQVEFPNEDYYSHNVFSKAAAGAFDTGVFGRGNTRVQRFTQAGVVPLYCNVHPRMTGYVVVLRSPWHAQSGDDGRFSIAKVPAGSYTLHAWHDRTPELTRAVTVPAAGLALARLELDARGYHFVQHKNKFGRDYTSATGDRY